jgi:hypothetical protein
MQNPSRSRNSVSRAQPRRKSNQVVTLSKVKQIVHSIVDAEVEDKFFDTLSSSLTPFDYNGNAPIGLTDITQGSSDTARDGDAAVAKRLTWFLFLRYNQTNTTANLAQSINVARLVIFIWKPFFADVAPTVGKVMTYTGTTYSVGAPLSHDAKDQFIVLVDTVVALDGFSKATKILRGSMPLNHKLQWKGGSTTNVSGGIYYFLISDAVTAGGLYPEVRMSSFRVDFQDA